MTRTCRWSEEMSSRNRAAPAGPRAAAGGRWSAQRPVVEAIRWPFRTRSPWADLPRDLPSWRTVRWRTDPGAKDGSWDRVPLELQGGRTSVTRRYAERVRPLATLLSPLT